MKGPKMKRKLPKARNPFALHAALKTGSGMHEKPYKTKRRNEKIKLKNRKFDEI